MASDSILSPEALRSAHASEEAYVKAVGAVNYFLPAAIVLDAPPPAGYPRGITSLS